MSKLPLIQSLQNPKVKRVVKLRDSSSRRKLGRFLIDGAKEIQSGLAGGFEIETIFAAQLAPWTELASDLLQPVTADVLRRISYGQQEDAPVAVAVTPELPLERVKFEAHSLLLVLDRTEKPGNLGACLRTAAACGVDAVVLCDPVCELFNPNTIRASRGAVFQVPLACTRREAFLQLCETRGISIWAARVDGQTGLWDADFRSSGVVLFGSEAQGLGEAWDHPAVRGFRIPMQESVDSLNLSISAALSLYEAQRQRQDRNLQMFRSRDHES